MFDLGGTQNRSTCMGLRVFSHVIGIYEYSYVYIYVCIHMYQASSLYNIFVVVPDTFQNHIW